MYRLKSFLRQALRILKKSKLFLFVMPLKKFSGRIILSNNVDLKTDGVGAQIQRMLAVAATADLFQTHFLQRPIAEIAKHPLDPYQNEADYQEFIECINKEFEIINTDVFEKAKETWFIEELSIFNIVCGIAKSFLINAPVCLDVVSPYRILDLKPEHYLEVMPAIITQMASGMNNKNEVEIAVHFRQGVGGMAIYPGQAIPREMNEGYFVLRIQEVLKEITGDYRITVYTDAPNKDIEYIVPENQEYLWEGSPGFKNGIMCVKGNPLLELTTTFPGARIIIGGNPLEAIKGMALADYLITSRSSLSYVAGILNRNGKIISAPDFWHPKLRHWV